MRPQAEKLLRAGGVIPAFPLALHADGSFDARHQRALIRYYLDAGADGLAAAVHTTQFAIRRPEIGLLEPVLRICAEEIDAFERASGRTVVRIAGVCGETEQAVAEARLAASLGYDAVLLSTGGLAGYSEDELITRACAIAGLLPIVGFYLQPAVGGRRLSFSYWEKLCRIENLVAIKAAPFDRYMTLDVMRAVAESPRRTDIALYTGNDDNIVIDLLSEYCFSGARVRFAGGLLGHFSVWTRSAVELFARVRAVREDDMIPAELFVRANEVTDCNAAFFDAAHGFAGCIPGVHEVLRRQGLLESTRCLDPDETLSPGQAEEIDRVYDAYPHLNDDDFVHANLARWMEERTC